MKFLSRTAVWSLFASLTLSAIAGGAPGLVIGRNFTGISYGNFNTNSSALPPDSNGAVGTNYFVEFINGIFVVRNKTNGTLVGGVKTDVDFWAGAGVGIDTADLWDVSDPRVIYDPTVGRWFASQIDVDVLTQLFDGVLGTNHFLLAVSEGPDPTGAWHGESFDSDPTGQNFADFPTLGVDGQGVYLSGDMFDAAGDPATSSDVGCSLVSFPKSDLLAIPPIFTNRTWFGTMDFSQRGQVLQPATCLDGSTVGHVLAAGDIGNDSSPHSNLVTFAVQNITAPGAATLGNSVSIPVSPYMVPENAAVGLPLFTAMQPDGTSTLMGNDARFSAKVYAVGGVLYGVHNTELNGRIAIRWYRVRASDGLLLESGTLADTNLDLLFPSIAANASGTVVIGYNGSGLSTFVSCYAVAGQTFNGVTTFGSPALLQAGALSYHGDDEDPTGQFGSPTSRWGDYSATSVDPSDPNRFWTIQEYPSGTFTDSAGVHDAWSTRITELITAPQPVLTIARSGSSSLLSWPSSASTFHLQSNTNLTLTNGWSSVAQTPSTNGSVISVLVPQGSSQQFFRLSQGL